MTPGHRVMAQAVHRAVSFGALAFLVIHIVTEILAQRAHVIDAFIPFLSPYRTFYIGLGTIASDLILLIVVTSIWRKRFTAHGKAWRWRAIHYSSYVAFVFGVLHGLLGGREAKPYVDWSYGFAIALTALAVVVRFLAISLRSKDKVSAPPGADRAAGGLGYSGTSPLRSAALSMAQAQLSGTIQMLPTAVGAQGSGLGLPGSQAWAALPPAPDWAASSGPLPALPAGAGYAADPSLMPLGAPVYGESAAAGTGSYPYPAAPGRQPLYEPEYDGPPRFQGAPRKHVPQDDLSSYPYAAQGRPPGRGNGGTGPLPLSPPPRLGSGPTPRAGTGPMPRADSGPMPRLGTGPMPRTDTGPMPRLGSGPMPIPGAGSMPRADSGPMPRLGSGPMPIPGRPDAPRPTPARCRGSGQARCRYPGRDAPRRLRPDAPPRVGPDAPDRLRPDAAARVRSDADTRGGSMPRADSGPMPRLGTGPMPRTDTGPMPRLGSGPMPIPGTGSMPRADSGPMPRLGSGPVPRADSGPAPRLVAGPVPRPDTGPMPRIDTGPLPRLGTGPAPRADSGPHAPPRDGSDAPDRHRPDAAAGIRPDADTRDAARCPAPTPVPCRGLDRARCPVPTPARCRGSIPAPAAPGFRPHAPAWIGPGAPRQYRPDAAARYRSPAARRLRSHAAARLGPGASCRLRPGASCRLRPGASTGRPRCMARTTARRRGPARDRILMPPGPGRAPTAGPESAPAPCRALKRITGRAPAPRPRRPPAGHAGRMPRTRGTATLPGAQEATSGDEPGRGA